MKRTLLAFVALCMMSAPAFAGTIRGNSSTRHWCEVNGENISVSPTEPPSATWKAQCKQAGGKIKGGLTKVTALAIRTVMGKNQGTTNTTNRQVTKVNAQIRALTKKLRSLKKLRNKLKRKAKALKKLKGFTSKLKRIRIKKRG